MEKVVFLFVVEIFFYFFVVVVRNDGIWSYNESSWIRKVLIV